MFENGQITEYAEKLNVIETNRFSLQKEGFNKIELGIKMDPMGLKNVKNGGQ